MSLLKELVKNLAEAEDEFNFGGGSMDTDQSSGSQGQFPQTKQGSVNSDRSSEDDMDSEDNMDSEDDMGSQNPEDSITMDVPLLIRIMEWAHEEAKSDMELHKVAENLVAMSMDGQTLSMDNYDDALNGIGEFADDAEPDDATDDVDSGYGDNGSMPMNGS
jgi:hypothetical protein